MSTVPTATAKTGIALPAGSASDASSALHPAPGATATLIGDLRELFKFKVTAMSW